MKERRPTRSTTSLPLPTRRSHPLKTCTKPPTLKDRLSLEPVASPLRNKSITTSRSEVVDLQEDEEQTSFDQIGGGGGVEQKLEPNFDKVIDNI